MPTAMSSTLPRMANSLNAFSMCVSFLWRGSNDRLCAVAEAERDVRFADYS
jgi:hypothetical protein